MYISSLSIRNFRNFKCARFIFNDGINTIIGENGSGKTNLFFALRILVDDTLPRYIRFNSTDFNRSLGSGWAGHWIIISIVFDELNSSEEAQALAVQSSGHMDTNTKGSYAVYFRPKYQFRKELFDYSQTAAKDVAGLKLLLDKITLDNYETVYLSRGSADFCNEATYKKYIGNFDTIEFPDPDDKEELIFGTWLPKEINIHNEVSCTFIKALRDVESDLKSYANNPLINLLKGKERTVAVVKQQEIIDSIDSLNDQISSLDEVKKVKKGIDRSLKETVGTTYAPNINLKSELPNEMEKLFQSLKLWVGDPDDESYEGRLWELSLGGANLIYLSLKLLEYENVKADKIANFLLIEEPEAHIHTHIQKTLFNNLGTNQTQILISTHSTHISSVSKISKVNILCRGKQEAAVFHPSNNLTDIEIGRIERYLDAVRSTLLFAKGILLVEGDAEQILIPEMFHNVFGLSLDEIGLSLVNIGSTGFKNVARLFHTDRIQKNCAIITDNDLSILPLNDNPDEDTDAEKECRASQKSGAERKIDLNAFCKGNKYLMPYYATYTFEVDVLMNANSHEYVCCLPKIYKTPGKIAVSKARLEDDDVAVAGTEVLRLAEKFGKGWLALLTAEQLVYNTYIPDYILKAIAFGSAHLNPASRAKAVRHRLKSIKGHAKSSDYSAAMGFVTKDKENQEIVDDFYKTFPNDQLTQFLAMI